MNWAHVHLILNHIPVVGVGFGLVLLLWSMWRRDVALQRAALTSFFIVAVVAIPVYLTGEPAEEIVEHLPGTTESAIESHETAALAALLAVSLLGAVALLGLLLPLRWSRVTARAALLVALAGAGLMAWTANLGGRIRHAELRSATAGQDERVERHSEGR